MLSGVFYGAQYGGSTTAILVKIPGETSSVVTMLDGHALAQQGRAGPALAIAALGSLFAGSVVTLLIAVGGPPLAKVALLFQSADYVSVMILGLVSAVVLAHGSVLKAVGMIVLGVMFGVVGTDISTGEFRLTMGLDILYDGIGFVPLSMGLFGLAEIMVNLESATFAALSAKPVSGLLPTRTGPPGVAARDGAAAPRSARSSASCRAAGRRSRRSPPTRWKRRCRATPEKFGNGAIEGVAAPESANNAAAQASFIPMLSLGIPPNALMALMIGAMMVHGIAPGPDIITKQPVLFWGLIASMWIGNLMLVILNLPLIGIWVRLLQVPYVYLFPTILVLCCVGTYALNSSTGDVLIMTVFGIVGYAFRKLDCEPAPLLLGLVLGPDAGRELPPRHGAVGRRLVGVRAPADQPRLPAAGGRPAVGDRAAECPAQARGSVPRIARATRRVSDV